MKGQSRDFRAATNRSAERACGAIARKPVEAATAAAKAGLVAAIGACPGGYADFIDILQRLSKHKIGKSCLYINKLADIDEAVLARLIRAGLRDLETHWPVEPT